jgi:hypothetical protein
MQTHAPSPFRRIIMAFAIIVCAISLVPNRVLSQGTNTSVTNAGTEFLVCFMQNESKFYDATSAEFQEIYIVSADTTVNDTVIITCKAYPKLNKKIILSPGTSSSIWDITTDAVIAPWPPNDGIINSHEVVDSMVFKVVSSSPIICYGISNKSLTCDAFLVLPKSVASTDYLVMSYPSSNTGIFSVPSDRKPSEFCVASFDDGNLITIVPATNTMNGAPAGQPITFTLNSGECVQIQADVNISLSDLTGSTVRSTMPVTVYGGHARTEVPIEYSRSDGGSSRDYLSEEMPALSTWGISFIAKNFGSPIGDLMRVMASVDSTTIKINGNIWGTPLMAGEHRDTMIAKDIAVVGNNIFSVEADNPILVGMFAHTTNVAGGTGDPFFAVIPSLDQTYHEYTYFISPSKQFITHSVIISTEASGAGKITIDGQIIPKAAYTLLPVALNGKQYAVATINQSPGIHKASSPNSDENGFTLLAFGFGPVDSYGYTAGALLKPITGLSSLRVSPDCSGNIIARNILSETIILDSSKILYTQKNTDATVSLKNLSEKNTIAMSAQQAFTLEASKLFNGPIKGKVRIYYHTATWHDLRAVDFPFCLAGVAGTENEIKYSATLENFPNPVTGKTTVIFSLPAQSYASVKIYDALGRIVRTLSEGITSEGKHSIDVLTSGLVAGSYMIELLAPELGVSERCQIVVIE